jgi:hypothetical protein
MSRGTNDRTQEATGDTSGELKSLVEHLRPPRISRFTGLRRRERRFESCRGHHPPICGLSQGCTDVADVVARFVARVRRRLVPCLPGPAAGAARSSSSRAAPGWSPSTRARTSSPARCASCVRPRRPTPRRRRSFLGYSGYNTAVKAVAFSTDGENLVTAGDRVVLRDLTDRAAPCSVGDPLRHRDEVLSAAFAPHQPILATAGADQAVVLWDVSGARSVHEPAETRSAPSADADCRPKNGSATSPTFPTPTHATHSRPTSQ